MAHRAKRLRRTWSLPARLASIAFLTLLACKVPDRSTFRVMTFNLAHGGGVAGARAGLPTQAYQSNIDAVAAVVRREQPDVLAIQEADAPSLWSGSFDHVQRLADKAKLPEVFHGVHFDIGLGKYRIAYGTALLSRQPLRKTASYRSKITHLHTKGFVTAEVMFDHKTLIVASIHLDSGSRSTRQREVEQIIEVLTKANRPIILMGDLNSRWSPKNDAARILAARLDLEAYHPERNDLDTFSTKRPRARIDWILISKTLEFISYRVIPDEVSDHRAVIAEVRWRP